MKYISVLIICLLFGQVNNIGCKLLNISRTIAFTQCSLRVWAKSGCNCSHFQLVMLWFANTKKVSSLLGGWPACGWVRDNRLIADDDAVFLTFSLLLSVTSGHLPVRRNAPLDQILAPADEENAQRTSPLSNRATSHHTYQWWATIPHPQKRPMQRTVDENALRLAGSWWQGSRGWRSIWAYYTSLCPPRGRGRGYDCQNWTFFFSAAKIGPALLISFQLSSSFSRV